MNALALRRPGGVAAIALAGLASSPHALGRATVYRDPRTGELSIDADSIRGVDDIGFGDDDFGDDDFGDEPYGLGDDDFGDDDFGDDDFGDDDFGDEPYGLGDDEVGARRRRRRTRRTRRGRAARRRTPSRPKAPPMPKNPDPTGWKGTIVSGSVTLGAAGSSTIAIRLQHDFLSENFKVSGLAASTITSVRFGDRLIFDGSVPIDLLSATATFTDLLKGETIRGGLDILIGVTLPGAGTVSVALSGKKPVNC